MKYTRTHYTTPHFSLRSQTGYRDLGKNNPYMAVCVHQLPRRLEGGRDVGVEMQLWLCDSESTADDVCTSVSDLFNMNPPPPEMRKNTTCPIHFLVFFLSLLDPGTLRLICNLQ
jgi:hypothetical protein